MSEFPNYKNIIQKIYDNRFSIKRKKILLFIKLNKNREHHFELIEDYSSIANINEILNTNNSLEIKLSSNTIKLIKN
jgi:PHP family Zn ribbon phosphoesterase